MDKDEALAIAFANLKGPRDKDYMATAEALAYLRSLPEYPSNAAVGRAVAVSGEIVREFVALTRLPEQIQKMFRRGLLRLEHGRRLAQLRVRSPEKIAEAATAIADMNAHESRELILYLIDHPNMPVAQARRLVSESRTVTEHEFHVIALLEPEEFKRLSQHARRARKTVNELVSLIVRDWLAQARS